MSRRLVGAFGLIVGVGLVAWVWQSALTRGRYSLGPAAIGPMLAVLALAVVVHGDHAVLHTCELAPPNLWDRRLVVLRREPLPPRVFSHEDTIGRAFEVGFSVLMIGAWLLPRRVLEPYSPPED